MANLDEVYGALQKADAAGDTDAAKQLADYIRAQSADVQPTAKPQAAMYDMEDAGKNSQLSMAREAVRTVGRFGKAVAEGGLSIATLPLDLGAAAGNFALSKAGSDMRIPSAGQAVSDALSDPTTDARNSTERVEEDVVRAGAGALSGAGLAKQLIKAGIKGPMLSKVLEALGSQPGTQTAAAAAGGLASGVTRENGGSTGQQLLASVVGGIPGSAAAGTVRGATRGLTEIAGTAIAPTRQRSVIAGNILNDAATNPRTARDALKNAAEIVPGSAPTSGEAAKDPGLAYLQNRLRSLDQSKFSTRISAQNEARQAMLDTIADGGQPAAIESRIAARKTITDKLRDTAFQQAQGKPANGQSIIDEIDRIAAIPENRGESVQKALDFARKQLTNADGSVETDVKGIYAARKEINRILEGKYVGADESVLRNAGGQLAKVKTAIDDAITDVAPDWKRYLSVYSRMSKPIERAQELGRIRGKTDLAAPDINSGRDYLSQAKFKNVVTKNLPELQKTLAGPQISRLRTVAADLDRGAAAANSASVAVPGSATAANLVAAGNMTVAHVLGRVLGSKGRELPPALAGLTKPLSWVLSYNDQKIRELIVDAMLDPKLAADLMRRGTPKAVATVADSLLKNLQAGSAGSAAAAATAE